MRSLIKSCETLAFLVRDAAHITPHNFAACVHAIRTFVVASVDGGELCCRYTFLLYSVIAQVNECHIVVMLRLTSGYEGLSVD